MKFAANKTKFHDVNSSTKESNNTNKRTQSSQNSHPIVGSSLLELDSLEDPLD